MRKLTVFLLALAAAAVPACGAPPEPPHAPSPAPLVAVPVGFHTAITAVFPEVRVLEYAGGDTLLTSLADVILLSPEMAPPQGTTFIGPWLMDRLVLAVRIDLGPVDTVDSDVIFETELTRTTPHDLPLISALDQLVITLSEDGRPRVALTEIQAARLLSGGEDTSSDWTRLNAAATPYLTDSPLEALLEKRVEAAVLDPGQLAHFTIREHPLRDCIAIAAFDAGHRDLSLFTRTGHKEADEIAHRLMNRRATLRSLGYAPAR